ncbi:MAG: hypothetical protein FJ109_20810, partial [Deltaproteobacteria bacterium]|nr:hypothetical protein [Deltaproteobacteria bacterium]
MTGGNELAAPADVTLSRREERAEFWFQVAFWCLVIAMVPDVTRKFVDLPALEFIGYLEHAGPVLLTYAAWLTYTGTPSRAPFLTPAYRVWLVLFIAWCAVLTARFFLLERSYRFLLMIDLYPTLAFVAGVVMGGKLVHERLWDRLYMRLLPPGVFMLLAGLAGIRTAVRIEAVTSEGYGMEVLVEPVLFLLLTLDSRFRVREKYLIVGSLVVYALSQVLFQKRAPTARIAVFLLVFTLVCPLLSRQAGLTRAILLRYVV